MQSEESSFIPVVREVNGMFEASCPAREIVCIRETRDEALGALIRCYCRLGRSGAIDPSDPEAGGDDVIQHVLSVLTEHLQHVLEMRREVQHVDECRGYDAAAYGERIASIGTAIAAVGRVKDAPRG